MALIELHGVFKTYHMGDTIVRALDGISLCIEQGEFVAVVGQSGSGKSTLMNIIGCLDTATQGEYFLEGRAVFSMPENHLSRIRNRKIGFIFQGFNLVPTLDALENIELPLIYRGISRDVRRRLALRALESVGLSDRARHRPCELSGGQQQRVAIARAVASSPPIILADEPTGNLDVRSGNEIMEILHGMHRAGQTVILITHDQTIARSAQRRIGILDGRLEA